VACEAGVPTIILEAGEVWKIEPGVVEVGVRGAMNVLKQLEMVSGAPVTPRYQTKIRTTTWVRAERGGTLGYQVAPGDLITKGQALAHNFSMFGTERSEIASPVDGIILGMTTMPVVKPGDPAFHIANLSRASLRRIQKRVDESSSRHLFNRVQGDLSTNVHLVE